MTPDELDLIDGDQLLDAITRRYECYVFAAARNKTLPTDPDDPEIVTVRFSRNGDRLRNIGLCQFLATRIATEINDELGESVD